MSISVRTGWLVLALLVTLVASQALATVSAPPVPVADTGRVLGHAGFAYMGVFRTYAAAVLWNRIEPVFHGYYSSTPLREQDYLMPTIYMVLALDPQLEQPYYIGAYTLAARGDFDQALRLARDGVKDNPRSGLLRANYVQILLMQDSEKNMPILRREVAAGLGADVQWTSAEDMYEGLAIFRSVYRQDGDKASEANIQAAMDKLSAQIDVGDHDHDGDGDQDH